MTLFSFSIDTILQDDSWCSMIGPQHEHLKDANGFFTRQEKARNPYAITLLDHTISSRMQELHKQDLLKNLQSNIPILYIDCQ